MARAGTPDCMCAFPGTRAEPGFIASPVRTLKLETTKSTCGCLAVRGGSGYNFAPEKETGLRCLMYRSMIAGVALALMMSSGALAQNCTGNPVAVQVLGSGAPGFVKDRANTSYLLWIGNQAKILVDAGGGAYVRFGQ